MSEQRCSIETPSQCTRAAAYRQSVNGKSGHLVCAEHAAENVRHLGGYGATIHLEPV